MNKTKLLAIVAAVGLGVAVSYLPLRDTWAWIKACYWQQQLIVTADDEVEEIIHKIGRLDKAGIAVLAQALGSERECIAWAAKQELLRLLDNWRNLSAKKCASRQQILAEALAREVDDFSPAARSDAVELATRILAWPLKGRGGDTYKLLAATEKVLRSGMDIKGKSISPQAGSPLPLGQLEKDISPADAQLSLSKEQASNGGASDRLKPLPEVEQAVENNSPPAESVENKISHTANVLANQPSLLDQKAAGGSSKILFRLPQVSRIADHVEKDADVSSSAKEDRQSASGNRIDSTSFIGPGASDRQLSAKLAAKDALELLQELNDEDEAKAAQAEAELLRRGFTGAQLTVAERLFDPNPAIRKELVRQLLNLEGMNTVPLLLCLARDQDAEVRLAAITVMATSSDPAVLDQVDAIVQSDTDSAVRRIADRIAMQRKSLR